MPTLWSQKVFWCLQDEEPGTMCWMGDAGQGGLSPPTYLAHLSAEQSILSNQPRYSCAFSSSEEENTFQV
jgi:hypothetical protein